MDARDPLFADDLEPAVAGRIVIGYDGSPAARVALERAAEMAEARHGILDVVTAWHSPAGFAGHPAGSRWSPRDDAGRMLRDGIHAQFGDSVPEWVRAHLPEGPSARMLIDASEGADTLVVGSRGHGGFVGLLLGSVSAACAEHATCPVLIVHEDEDREARHDRAEAVADDRA